MDINGLIKTRVHNQMTGETFRLLGFTCAGDDRTGWNVVSMRLYDENSRRTFDVGGVLDLKKFSVLTE
jgi:hypothetical protein